MDFAAVIFYPIALGVGLFLTFRQKKLPGVVYGPLDYASIALNIVLTMLYGFFCIMPMFLGMLIRAYKGEPMVLQLLGLFFSAITCAAPVYCAIALGMSASLRRRGRAKAGFFVQFAGIAGIVIPVLFTLLLEALNLPWLNTSLN